MGLVRCDALSELILTNMPLTTYTHHTHTHTHANAPHHTQSGELLFIDLEKAKQETSATKIAEYHGLADTDQTGWSSQTCVLGWGVVGIWPPGADGTDINCADKNEKGNLLATGDDFGQVKIFNYPCAKVSWIAHYMMIQ
jgi:hypothetical protein